MLPLRDNDDKPFDRAFYDSVHQQLTRRFGGLTVYNRAPAEGLFSGSEGQVTRDDVVIFEVMCDAIDDTF